MNNVNENSSAKRFRFIVVDLGRSRNYPENYVCMLAAQIGTDLKKPSTLVKIFGDKSTSLAKQLLADAIEGMTDTETKAEIERRLKVLKIRGAKQDL